MIVAERVTVHAAPSKGKGPPVVMVCPDYISPARAEYTA